MTDENATDFAWDSVPEDLRKNTAFEGAKNLTDILQSAVSAQKMIGVPAEQLLRLPAAGADPTSWEGVYDRLGRPKSAEEYKLDASGPAVDDAYQKSFRSAAHAAGLSQRQAAAIVDWNEGYIRQAMTTRDASTASAGEAAIANMKETLGSQYDSTVALASAAVKQFGLDGLVDTNNPKVVEALAAIGKEFGEEEIMHGASNGGFTFDAHDAASEITRLTTSDSEFQKAYYNQGLGHKEAVKRIQDLQSIVSGEGMVGG